MRIAKPKPRIIFLASISTSRGLFYRHALGQIRRLINITPVGVGDIVSEELQRDRRHDRREELLSPRDRQHAVRGRADRLVALRGDDDALALPGAHLLDVRDDLLVDRRLRREEDDRPALADERDRPVLHFARRIALGVDERADLFELQRALEGSRVVVPAAERSEERRVGKECRSWWSPYH